MRVHLTSARFGHGVPNELRIDGRRIQLVYFLEPGQTNVEHIDYFVSGQIERVVIAADDYRMPFIVFECVGRRVRQLRFDSVEYICRRVSIL